MKSYCEGEESGPTPGWDEKVVGKQSLRIPDPLFFPCWPTITVTRTIGLIEATDFPHSYEGKPCLFGVSRAINLKSKFTVLLDCLSLEHKMIRYGWFIVFLMLVFLLLFLAAEQLQVPLLTDPLPLMQQPSLLVAAPSPIPLTPGILPTHFDLPESVFSKRSVYPCFRYYAIVRLMVRIEANYGSSVTIFLRTKGR